MEPLREKTILVVDDEPDLCEMVAFEFQLLGSKVFAASNGLSALSILESEQVDAVVTDIRMSGCDGIELLKGLRARNPVRPIVILMTAYDSDLSPREAYRMGAEGILLKPFSLKDLVSIVERSLIPLEERWSAPPSVRPCEILNCRWPDYDTARREGWLALGRGGLALVTPAQCITLGQAAWFDIEMAAGPLTAIEGSGTIRWIRQGNDGDSRYCGIEFDYLTDRCRPGILEGLTQAPSKPFIPSL